MQQRLRQTDEELDNLIGVRSRAISRKLRAVQTLDENTAAALLELGVEYLWTGHCTGPAAFALLKEELGDRVGAPHRRNAVGI